MKRITISVPDAVAAKVNRAVKRGEADNVSAYFSNLASREPDWELAEEAIDRMVSAAGGVPESDYQWALESLGITDDALVGATA